MQLSRTTIATAIGVGTIATGILYAVLAPVFGYAIEWAGVTMLLALGIALGMMAFVLHSGPGE